MASPDPLAALREAEPILLWICEGDDCDGWAQVDDDDERLPPHCPIAGCGDSKLIEVIPLKATEPLIAENEELRRERDEARRCREYDYKRFITARSTSEALAGALEELIAEWKELNGYPLGAVQAYRDAASRLRSVLDSARTPTEENPNG